MIVNYPLQKDTFFLEQKCERGWLFCYDSVSSTIDIMHQKISLGEGTFVLAKSQTSGRGKAGRPWVSTPGNFYLSFIVEPFVEMQKVGQLSILLSVALIKTLIELGVDAERVKSKWPNDIFIDNKKIAGILLEVADVNNNCIEKMILSFGLNVESCPLDYPSTYLYEYLHQKPSTDVIFNVFVKQFWELYDYWKKDSFDSIKDLWIKHCLFSSSERIQVSNGSQKTFGFIKGLSDHGELLLCDDDGMMHKIYSGDLFLGNV